MRAIIAAIFMTIAGPAAAGDFGVQLSDTEDAMRSFKNPLRRVECNAQRCVFQNPAKDITAFIRVDDRRTVTGFYLFYRPTNWAIAAEYVGQIQATLKLPASDIVDVRSVAEAGKDGKRASVSSKSISCRSEGGSTPTVICERS